MAIKHDTIQQPNNAVVDNSLDRPDVRPENDHALQHKAADGIRGNPMSDPRDISQKTAISSK
jgi:hypothetical protein